MDRFARTFTVRWGDCDANGHMRNTAYSEYCTDVRVEFLAERGCGFEVIAASGFGPVLIREEIDYLRELRMGDSVEVDLRQLGMTSDRSRFRVAHDFIRADGKPCARIVVEGGWMDLRTRRLAPPPPALGDAWAQAPKDAAWVGLAAKKK
jgi:acyl-CoA thioester hydrolase